MRRLGQSIQPILVGFVAKSDQIITVAFEIFFRDRARQAGHPLRRPARNHVISFPDFIALGAKKRIFNEYARSGLDLGVGKSKKPQRFRKYFRLGILDQVFIARLKRSRICIIPSDHFIHRLQMFALHFELKFFFKTAE